LQLSELAHEIEKRYELLGWWMELQVAVGSAFVFWLNGASLSSPYKMCG
jgi:hypothetical protein